MASPEVLSEFPPRHRGRPPLYPWDQWTDGQIYVLKKGEHFQTAPSSFRALAHRTATTRGLKVKTQIDGDRVVVEFYDPADES